MQIVIGVGLKRTGDAVCLVRQVAVAVVTDNIIVIVVADVVDFFIVPVSGAAIEHLSGDMVEVTGGVEAAVIESGFGNVAQVILFSHFAVNVTRLRIFFGGQVALCIVFEGDYQTIGAVTGFGI